MGQLSLLRYMMFKCSKVSLQSLLQPQCRSIVFHATSAGARTVQKTDSSVPQQLENPVFKKPALAIAKTEIQPVLTLQGAQSLVSAASGSAQTTQPSKEPGQPQLAQRKDKVKLTKAATEPPKKQCPIKICATSTQTKPAIRKPRIAPITRKRASSALRAQKMIKAQKETEASVKEAAVAEKNRGGESRTAPEKTANNVEAKRIVINKNSSNAEAKMGAASKIKSSATKKTTAPDQVSDGVEKKITSEEIVVTAPSDSKSRDALQPSLTAQMPNSHITPETVPSKRSVTFADTIRVDDVEKSIAPTPFTPAHGCSEVSRLTQSTEEWHSVSATSAQPSQTTQTAEFVNIGESINSATIAQQTPGQTLVLDTANGQMTCIGLESVMADRMRRLDQAQDTKTIGKAWSIFSPQNRLRRLIEEDSEDGGAQTIRRTSSILENGIRQIRRRLPSAYHHQPLASDGSLLPFRDTLASLARRDFSLRKIKALRIIEDCGGTLPSPARISIDRKLQNEYRDNRASILKIKFVTNQWVVPRYIVEHFEKFHKPPFQPNGNVDEKRITDSITIVLKLSQPLFLTSTPI
ncbi:hypothetical protein V9T40_002799 [Parthenolecanium corni]|uniref:Uncharacterized protein n=1 Tax=Parthenolecanium corni TaxID=536013 RepID=A0AAN9TXI9_9HEMI